MLRPPYHCGFSPRSELTVSRAELIIREAKLTASKAKASFEAIISGLKMITFASKTIESGSEAI